MLSIDRSALPVVRRMVGLAPDPSQAGLRIAGSAQQDALSFAVEPNFRPGDIVLHLPGTRVFIDPAISDLIDDKELVGVPRAGDIVLAFRDDSVR